MIVQFFPMEAGFSHSTPEIALRRSGVRSPNEGSEFVEWAAHRLNLARTCESTLLPEFFPMPNFVGVLDRKAQLVRQHAYLAAMMSVVRNHVGKHSGASGPGSGPAIAEELPDATLWPAQGFREHL